MITKAHKKSQTHFFELAIVNCHKKSQAPLYYAHHWSSQKITTHEMLLWKAHSLW
jgi:hypothetical protein